MGASDPLPTPEELRARRAPTARSSTVVGVWRGRTVLRRLDADGVLWTIRAVPGASIRGAVVLTMAYREHRCTSRHVSADEAKAHRDDLVAAFNARTMAEYDRGRGVVHSDDAQLGMVF